MPHRHGQSQSLYGGYSTGELPSSHQRRSSTQRRGINSVSSGGPFGAQTNGLRSGGATRSTSSRASDILGSPRSGGGRGTLPPLRHTYRPRWSPSGEDYDEKCKKVTRQLPTLLPLNKQIILLLFNLATHSTT